MCCLQSVKCTTRTRLARTHTYKYTHTNNHTLTQLHRVVIKHTQLLSVRLNSVTFAHSIDPFYIVRHKKRHQNIFYHIFHKGRPICIKFYGDVSSINLLQNDINIYYINQLPASY